MHAATALLNIIEQIKQVLKQFSPEEYRTPLPEYEGSSVGQHVRHILEFFQCLDNGIPGGLVDYAGRPRNLQYESDPLLAAEALDAFADRLRDLQPETPVSVRAEFGSLERPDYASTVGRELAFVYDHAIHHLAIIRIGLHGHFRHIQVPQHLGVSPATVKFRTN
jgi:uncharacterized damage-inducible protein DinB